MTQAVFGNGGYAEGRRAQPVEDPVEKALALLGVHQSEIVKTVSQESRREDRSAGLSTMKRKVDPAVAALGGFGAATGTGVALWGANTKRRIAGDRQQAVERAVAGRRHAGDRADSRFAGAARHARAESIARTDLATYRQRQEAAPTPRKRAGYQVHINTQQQRVKENWEGKGRELRTGRAIQASSRRDVASGLRAARATTLSQMKRNKIGRGLAGAGAAGLAGTAALMERRNRTQPAARPEPKKPAGPSLAELARRQRVEQAKIAADRYRSM